MWAAPMRREVVAVMSGVSVVVAGTSLLAGQRAGRSSVNAAPAGVVGVVGVDTGTQTTPTSTPTSGSPTPSTGRPSSSPGTSRTTASPTAVRQTTAARTRATVAPKPVATRTKPAPTPSPTVTVNGAPADTQYGPVQVQITVRGGRIVKADAIDYPQGSRRDQDINSQAIPQLDQETVNAQSAQIDTVSGATYTSDGYRQSLQSALDAAHQAGAL
jgi:uncharacterized protein with FMN-binding domain